MSWFSRFRSCVWPLCLGSSLFLATVAFGGPVSLERARVSLDARDPASPQLEIEVTVSAETALSEIEFYLADVVQIASASLEGRKLELASREVPGALLKVWTFRLPSSLSSGATASLTLSAALRGSAGSGIQAGEDGGYLLAGAGWFPAAEPWSDALVPHSTLIQLPDGMTGVACGVRAGTDGPWTATTPARPFAVWGRFSHDEKAVGETNFSVYRRSERQGEVPQLARIERVIDALEVALGEPCGSGSWTLVDVGQGILQGGQRAVFWDEGLFASGDVEVDEVSLEVRDLAGAIASSFWTDCLRFRGELAAWLSRGIALYLGDVASLASYPDYNDDTESLVIGSRRSDFLAQLKEDRPLSGLIPISAQAPGILATRGALVAHMVAEAGGSRTMWLNVLHQFRDKHGADRPQWADFLAHLQEKTPGQDRFLVPLLETTDLPDFRIVSQGPAQGKFQDRLRVEIENQGKAEYAAEVTIYTHKGHKIRSALLAIPPGDKRAILFKDPDIVGRIALDPRGFTLQPDLDGETVAIPMPEGGADIGPFIPSYEFHAYVGDARAVTGFQLELNGITILDFEGTVLPWRTYQGASGAALIGKGRVRIKPGDEFAAGFTKAMGREELHYGAADMWVRFPLATWQKIEPQLRGGIDAEDRSEIIQRSRRIHTFSFSTYFYEEMRAQIPPPGSALVIFTTEGEERLGFVSEPLPDGRVRMRLWDHLRQGTLWEETH